jgi:hypothetical protein
MDCRFKEIEMQLTALRIELRAEFQTQWQAAMEKLNARMDAQTRWIISSQIAILLALVALIASA